MHIKDIRHASIFDNPRMLFLASLATLAAAGALLRFFPTSECGLWPKCVFNLVTGLLCPGCGATRCVEAVVHGQFLYALRCNLLLPVALVVLGLYSWMPAWRGWKPTVIVLLVLVAIYTILRNLPCACLVP